MDADFPVLRWEGRHGDVVVAWEPVNREAVADLEQRRRPLRTGSFAVYAGRSSTLVVHRLDADVVDNDIGGLIADELVRPGIISGPHAFERCFAGLVESTGRSPRVAWRRFYVNTLTALWDGDGDRRPDGPIATFREIYRHAERLVRGASVLDVGSCFAFFPMLLSASGELSVTASDSSPGTVALSGAIAAELGLPVAFCCCDITRPLPFDAASFDTVTALHVLEHLSAGEVESALERLCRTARRRVVVAVPLEESPDPVYGHLQSFDLGRLGSLASRVPGWRGQAHEHRGGWLVLEPRSSRPAPSRGVVG